ncbi:MAG: DUF3293 domain-containing protein [Gammaproteobacteria bacterium]|nr:DUF3293 domain-containing protein [Gammaproteobacteria bacterium]
MTREQFGRRNLAGSHADIVETALKEGKSVPDYVLVDYIELAGKHGGDGKAAQLLDMRTMRDLGHYNFERPMGIREYLGEARDPFSAPPPSIFERYETQAAITKARKAAVEAELKFNEAKAEYERAIGEPWEKAAPFLERQRKAKQAVDNAKQELARIDAKMESLRDSVDALVKDIVENPDRYPNLVGKEVNTVLDFIEFKFGSRSKLTKLSRRNRAGALKVRNTIVTTKGRSDVNTLRRMQKIVRRRFNKKQQQVLKDVLDFEIRRLEHLEGRMATAEGALGAALKADRLRGPQGDRALIAARRRQSRNVEQAKSERDLAKTSSEAAKKAHTDLIKGPGEKLVKEYWEELERGLAEDIRNGSPVPESALERFPKLKEMEGVKSYKDAARDGEPMVKDTETVPSETISDIESLIPDEALVALEPVLSTDPVIQALEQQLLGPTWDMQTVKSLKAELRARGLRVSGRKQALLDRLKEFDRNALWGDFRGMQKLIKALKKQGFKPTNKGRTGHDLKSQLQEYLREVGNKPPAKPAKPAKPAAPKPFAQTSSADTMTRLKAMYEGRGNKGVLFTSDNPLGVTAEKADNDAAMKKLLQELDDAGIVYTKVKGKYTDLEDPSKAPMEDSILIEGLSEAESVALGARYRQDSVLTPKGFMHTTGENAGKITPSKKVVKDMTGEGNFFSRITTADGEVSFQVDIGWDLPKGTFDLAKLIKKGERALKKRTDALKPPPPEPLVAVSDAVTLARMNINAPVSGMRRWRSFFGGKWHSSFNAEVGHTTSHPVVRWLGDNILQDSIFKLDAITGKRIPSSMAGQTRAEMRTYSMFHELGETYQAGYAKWRHERGVTSSQRMVGKAEEAFGAEVADVVRGKKSADANVNAVAEGVRKTLKELDEHMLAEGLTDRLYNDPNYFPRKVLPSRVAALIVKAEPGAVDKLVADAIRKGHEAEGITLTAAESEAIANIYLTNINARHYAVDYQNNGFLGDNSALLLGEYLEKLGIEPEVRAAILKKTRVSKDGESAGFQKHRLLLDETHVGEVVGKDGTTSTVRMTDLFDNNAKRVMSTHIRQVHGAVESNRIGLRFNEMRGLSTAEQPLAATWTEMMQFVNRTAINEGRTPMEIVRINDQMKRMRELVGGYSTEKPSELATMARMMQKFAGATFGSTFGMASLAELGQPMAHSSVKAFLAHAKELPKLINDLRTGKISGQLQQELAMFTGVGTEGRFFRELATMLEHHPLGEASSMSKVETVIGNLQNGAFKLGLLTPIDAIQRQYAGMLFAQEFLNGALKGKLPYKPKRLLQIGLTEETAESIMKYMKLHAKYEGSGGNKLLTFNFKDWVGAEGREAAAAIQEAIVLHTRKTIHQTHAGQLPRILQNPLGRLLFQFRNFMLGSYETQLLSNLQAADARAMASFSTNTFFGLLSYLAITNAKFAGRPEELEKWLTAEAMAKGAFQRSGFATHVPALLDTIFQVGGHQGVFQSGRSSGLSAGFLSFDSTPVGSLVDGLTGTAQGIIAPMFSEDYQYSEKNFKKTRKVIPYQNAAGASYLLNRLEQAFPENSKE